jgi:parvulin-like peptidyl-prolyl isomerase
VRALRILAVAVTVMMAGCGDDGPPKVAATVGSEDITFDRDDAATQVLGFVIRSVYLSQVAAEMNVSDNPTAMEELAAEQVPAAEYESAGWSKTDLEQSLRDARLSKSIGEKVFPKVAVSDLELRQKYERSKDFFNQTWQIRARVAYFDTPEPAKTLKERGLTGETFDNAARELGAKQAGSAGLVTPLTPLPQPVLDVIAGLSAGQTSDPVAGGSGYLVAVADSREDKPPVTFEEAKPSLLKVLEDEQRQKLFFDWFNKRLGEAKVKVSSHYGKWSAENQLVS